MSRLLPLVANARVPLAEPDRLIVLVADHLQGHGARIVEAGRGETVLEFEFCRGVLRSEADALLLRAEAPDSSFLQEIKSDLAEHVEEFARLPPGSIAWDGDAGSAATPPNFRLITVAEVRAITPHMRRVRFAGETLTRFASSQNLHCKLLIPPDGHEPEWPRLDRHGRFVWPTGPGRPAIRKYTIRAIRPEAGSLDIDFVLHEDAGPGSAWAARAKVGDVIGMVGPGGRSVAEAASYLLAGDETALPAIARLLETLPTRTRGVALIEVANASEQQKIDNRTAIDIRWLHRDDAPAGAALLADAVRRIDLTAFGEPSYVWAAGEFETFRSIRNYLRNDRGLKAGEYLVVSYWRKGVSDDKAAEAPDDER